LARRVGMAAACAPDHEVNLHSLVVHVTHAGRSGIVVTAVGRPPGPHELEGAFHLLFPRSGLPQEPRPVGPKAGPLLSTSPKAIGMVVWRLEYFAGHTDPDGGAVLLQVRDALQHEG